MNIFKRLAKGELSLAITFWGFLILGCVLPSTIISEVISQYGIQSLRATIITLASVIVIKFIISVMVTSGIFFILRNKKITFWAVIAFIISILNFIDSIFGLLTIIYIVSYIFL
ncbi:MULTISPECIES: hypothetical protein [unclassified Gilliamella]|uniref:hypothetical protein n=1 Tax=unclassified Gilliamella TaxID=2685620 RepID=UPI000813850A|nr:MULTISPECIES: hypothetical protein [Gilliamella]MCX8727068.1 hypothetical protein [Gilliamella sp. B2838]OCL17812.1 hypothetical protein A9G03_10425 [Gilliamella apicola]